MIHRHALRSLLFAASLAAASVVARATPLHNDGTDGLGLQPWALDAAGVAEKPVPAHRVAAHLITAHLITEDALSAFSFDTTSALEETPLELVEDASLAPEDYGAAATQHGTGFLWAFALTGCGALGLAAFRKE